jgi:hypothetical protein
MVMRLIKLILLSVSLVFCLCIQATSLEKTSVDLVEQYGLYDTNKIEITSYVRGTDEIFATIMGQQDVAAMLRTLESAQPIEPIRRRPDCQIIFYSGEKIILSFSYIKDDKQLTAISETYLVSDGFANLIKSYLSD